MTVRHNFIFLCALTTLPLNGISFVYNLRISETTRRQAPIQAFRPQVALLTFANQTRQRRAIQEYQHIFGVIATLAKFKNSFYTKVDFSVGRTRQYIAGTSITPPFFCKRVQVDDILFSAGCKIREGKRVKLSVSGLLGIPTHQDNGLTGLSYGTGHVGLGGQLDGSYTHTVERGFHQFLCAARIVHFFPRIVPVLAQTQLFKFWPGDLVDVIVGYRVRIQKNNLEIGYNPTFLLHTTICPNIAGFSEQANYTRSNLYANYARFFKIKDHGAGVGLGVFYGFDHKPRAIGFKNIVTIWGAFGINF